MAFVYKQRPAEVIEQRANSKGGEDFILLFKPGVLVYKVREGENCIRILPPIEEYDPCHYGPVVKTHSNVGTVRASIFCPFHTYKAHKRCPVCEDVAKADREGNSDFAKEMRAKERTIVWIIDRKDEEKGPQIWNMAGKYDTDICSISKDDDGKPVYVDNPDVGYNVYFNMTKKNIPNVAKPIPICDGFRLAMRPTSVSDSDIEYIQQHLLTEQFVWHTPEAIREMIDGGADNRPEDKARPARTEHREERREERAPSPAREGKREELDMRTPPAEQVAERRREAPPAASNGDGRHMDGRDLPPVPRATKAAVDADLAADAAALRGDVENAEQTMQLDPTSRAAELSRKFKERQERAAAEQAAK